jgi:MtN3 and saliva related transmembrane protein
VIDPNFYYLNTSNAQLLGGLLISLAYVPQILRMLKTKSSRDVSLGFLWLILLSLLLMLSYSIELYWKQDVGLPLMITNLMNLVMVILTLWVARKLR